ncbi:hypothetical protein [Treponema brennaborense]|uniref:Uncharacterized protein n=1 Tax=Treponema brennaborense (strain DSM 12168 / CIP 105900 / DD5/3) TaxID=906968 RepID=F4LKI2_TREBD|nr:hypothetical protein [Treponema brennaborense]AEE17538.1 hypothetical protein Trebr_2123 [Treponema brennaborense DSM 12168]
MIPALLITCTAVGSICGGAAAASFFIALGARISGRSCGRHRFASVCLLLSAVVVCAAVSVITLPAEFQFTLSGSWRVYYGALFAFGAVLSCFYRIAVPLAASAYVVFALVCLLFLYSRFGAPRQELKVAVSADVLAAGGVTFRMESESPYRYAVVNVYTLNPALLLPLRRTWCRFAGFSDVRDFGAGDESSGDSRSGFGNLLCADKVTYYIEIPVADVASALYVVTYGVSGGELTYSLNRVL